MAGRCVLRTLSAIASACQERSAHRSAECRLARDWTLRSRVRERRAAPLLSDANKRCRAGFVGGDGRPSHLWHGSLSQAGQLHGR